MGGVAHERAEHKQNQSNDDERCRSGVFRIHRAIQAWIGDPGDAERQKDGAHEYHGGSDASASSHY
jgi:hypothetical protein